MQPLTADTRDFGNWRNGKIFLHLDDLANPKNDLNLALKPAIVPERY